MIPALALAAILHQPKFCVPAGDHFVCYDVQDHPHSFGEKMEYNPRFGDIDGREKPADCVNNQLCALNVWPEQFVHRPVEDRSPLGGQPSPTGTAEPGPL